jgi:hypothetical protein
MRRIIFFIVFLMCFPWEALADDPVVDAFPLRNHNPFLQVFGLPKFQTDELVRPDKIDFAISYDIANDADDAERAGGDLVIDGEMQTLSLSLRRRAFDRMEFGIDVPYVSHSGGSLDGLIKDWHNLVGLSNSMREGPNDQIQHSYALDGITRYELLVPQSGIGDVQLSAAYAMESVTFRASIKLPTGDPDKLTGSGATDVSLGLYAGSTTMLFDRAFDYSGFLGVLALGDGDVLPDFQESTVPYGGVALRWHVTERSTLISTRSAAARFSSPLAGTTASSARCCGSRSSRILPPARLRISRCTSLSVVSGADFRLHSTSIENWGSP